MSTAIHMPVHDAFALPWDTRAADTRPLNRWMRACAIVAFTISLVMPWLPLPERPPTEVVLPPPPAQILLERPEPPPPPPPPPPREVQPPKPEPIVERAPAPTPAPTPQPRPADARETAAVAGLLAFKDALADMRDAVDATKLQDTGAIRQGSGTAATVDRNVLASERGTRSAGVNVAALSSETGGVALAGRETTRVESSGGGSDPVAARQTRTPPAHQRSIEDIRRVFESNKGAIFAIYNRALRSDPSLRGQVVIELVIEPGGAVTDIRVVSSELADDDLLGRLVGRIRMFDFGAREVGTTRISYPVHFLPT